MSRLILTAALVAALGWAGNDDVARATDHESAYCKMVNLWTTTGGEQGWPPYNPSIICEEK